jgi:hypothetical protein
MKFSVMEVIYWVIVASLVVLVIMNPSGFVSDVGSVGTASTNLSKTLSGSGYVKAA